MQNKQEKKGPQQAPSPHPWPKKKQNGQGKQKKTKNKARALKGARVPQKRAGYSPEKKTF